VAQVFATRAAAAPAAAGAFGQDSIAGSDALKAARFELHSVLKQANADYARNQFNTVVSAGMKLLNLIDSDVFATVADAPLALRLEAEALQVLVKLLSPVVPHISHALWTDLADAFARQLGTPAEALLDAGWPLHDDAALKRDSIELVIQVNGKLRGKITVAADADNAAIEAAALANPDAQRFMEGKPAKKVIIVKGKLVNIVA
jgi:leucyl-tRNA synthetase